MAWHPLLKGSSVSLAVKLVGCSSSSFGEHTSLGDIIGILYNRCNVLAIHLWHKSMTPNSSLTLTLALEFPMAPFLSTEMGNYLDGCMKTMLLGKIFFTFMP